jgi:hypothetical protein
MKHIKSLSILAIIAMLFVAVVPAFAQLGQTDVSSFTVQNVDTVDATIHFYEVDGTEWIPSELNLGQPNPFTLAPGAAWEVYMPAIPVEVLPDGLYSVAIQANARVVSIANIIGQGDIFFNGSYSGFGMGAPTFYLPGVVFNYYGWYSLISVQNVDTVTAGVEVTINCIDGTIGTLSTPSPIAPGAAYTFDLETTIPTGFSAGTVCNGSAVINSNYNVVVVDNQTVPANGNTQSYSGVLAGDPTLYIPALYNNYFGWNGSLNIQKAGAGDTTVTVTFSDGDPDLTCDLTDANPSCLLYMPIVHPSTGLFSAVITNSAGIDLWVIANAANGDQAQTYNALSGGTMSVGIPSTMKYYYGWITSFTCQNVGTTTTSLHIEYEDYAGDAFDTADLVPGAAYEDLTFNQTFLPDGYVGGATVTANTAESEIACVTNFNNPTQMGSTVGDWSMSTNALNK